MFKSISIKSAPDTNCRICKKVFCCTECRDRHVDKVHPGLNGSCFLCVFKTLPMRQFEPEKLDLENERLLCHIIDKHLPLHCQLCGDIFESKEDFKSFGACKWWSRHCLTPPFGSGYLEKKLKRCSMSDSDTKFYTPSEIHRITSTPTFADQKMEYQTPCISEFSLKIPKINLESSSIVQYNLTAKTYESQNKTSDTEFFSFSRHVTNEGTPFKISKNDEKSFFRSNSSKKLDIIEKRDESSGSKIAIAHEDQLTPIDMDLTNIESGILRESPQLDPICEEPDETPEIVKKVRFSDEHIILPEFEERMESCVKSVLSISMEEENEFHDTSLSNTKNTENVEDATKEHSTKIVENTEVEKDAKCNQKEDEVCTFEKSLNNRTILNDLHVEINRDNTKQDEKEKENQNSKVNTVSSITSQQGTRVLMMVLVENNLGELNDDLMPLIGSGLKKLQEQIASANYSAPDTIETSGTSKLRRQSITKMQMTVSTVESYSMDNTTTAAATTAATAAATTNCQKIVQSSSPPQRKDNNVERNRGFLSSFTQAVKYALKNFSGLNVPSSSIEATKVVQRQEIIEKSTVTPKLIDSSSSNFINNVQIRSRKRARDEIASKKDSFTLESRSPLAKRHRRWYTMVKGRKPIGRMQSNRATSSRGVSTETQIFSQGSLTVGDTVLPLPARAHQSMQNNNK